MAKCIIFLFLFALSLKAFPQFIKDEVASGAIRNIVDGDADLGDFDGDGDIDLAICGAGGALHVIVYRNDDGAWVDIEGDFPGVDISTVRWGDFDNDNDLDLLLAGITQDDEVVSRIYRNDDGVFVDHEADLEGFFSVSAEWGDYDNDGDPDIAIIGTTAGDDSRDYLKVYRNDDGIFSDVALPLQPNHLNLHGTVSWGDYDNDGDLDLLVTGIGVNETGDDLVTAILRNDGGVFINSEISLPGVAAGDAEWGDYNDDGNLDVAIQGQLFDNTYFTGILRGDGNGTFTDINADLSAVSIGTIDWGDFDNDGDQDLLFTGVADETFVHVSAIYINDDGTFVNAGEAFPGVWGVGYWGDYDNDGDLDMFLNGADDDINFISEFYENTNRLFQSITFESIPDMVYGDSNFELTASANSGLDVSYEIINGPAMVSENILQITGVGEVLIEASQTGDEDYKEAMPVQQSFTINKAMLTVTADDQKITYGDGLPELVFSYSGFVNGEHATVLSSEPTVTTSAIEDSGVGVYEISLSGGSAENYDISLINGILTIDKATLTVTADDQNITYGDALPELTISYNGFVNGEDALILNSEPEVSTIATSDSDVGTYDITLSGGSADNYMITLVDGTLTIGKAKATVIISDVEEIYDGTPKEATITTNPVGLSYVATYDGDVSPPTEAGAYNLEVSIDETNYQGQASETFAIVLVAGLVPDKSFSKVTVYPIPSSRDIHFKGEFKKLDRVLIYDLNGKLVLEESMTMQQKIDVSHILPGTYILKLFDQSGMRKLVQTIIIK